MNYVGGDAISILDEQDVKNLICSSTTTVVPQNQSAEVSVAASSSATSQARSRPKKLKPPKPIPLTLDGYWPGVTEEIKQIKQVDAKNQNLPLARIKKIMKLDENAKMIAAEAPLLFAKACEYFIQELTLRAWIHTEENKRRTLQRSDIATAISRCDQFDFLIDIVPREEVKQTNTSSSTQQQSSTSSNSRKTETENPKPSTSSTVTAATTDPVQYYLQLGGGQHVTLQNPQQNPVHHAGILNQSIPASNQGITQLNVMSAAPQNILLNTQQTLVNALQQQQPQQQQIQLFQQVLTQNGEIQNVPITLTPNNLNLLRMQMQGSVAGQPQQQVIIQQQPQLMQVSGTTNAGASGVQTSQNPGIFLNQATIQHATDKQGNLVNNFRTNC